MEYIEGGDLSSLLRSTGPLRTQRGFEIARQICWGLHALHEKCILHRDLKPANVILDGRGEVRIADFGLAQLIGEPAEMAGTLAYMSPEQLKSEELTERSDIFSLGLVLYELFTGIPVFGAGDVQDQIRRRSDSLPATVADDLDPALDRAILQCLNQESADRPSSALLVAAALARAANRTPTPDEIASEGGVGSLPLAKGVTCLVCILLGLLLFTFLSDQVKIVNRVGLPLRPHELKLKAEKIVSQKGDNHPYTLYTAYGFAYDHEYLHREKPETETPRWENLEPSIYFWYRKSPRPLIPHHYYSDQIRMKPQRGTVSLRDPPHDVPGMMSLRLDTKGKLLKFVAAPEMSAVGGNPPHDANVLYYHVLRVLWVILLGSAALVAVRSLRLGRGDRRGAFRLAVFVFSLQMLAWLFQASHVPTLDEADLLRIGFLWALYYSASIWVYYLALEPYVRRLWPESLISSSRRLGWPRFEMSWWGGISWSVRSVECA